MPGRRTPQRFRSARARRLPLRREAALAAVANNGCSQRSMSRWPVRGTGHEDGRSRPGRAWIRLSGSNSVARPKACDVVNPSPTCNDRRPTPAASASPRGRQLVSVSHGKREQAAALSEGRQAGAKASGMRRAATKSPKGMSACANPENADPASAGGRPGMAALSTTDAGVQFRTARISQNNHRCRGYRA